MAKANTIGMSLKKEKTIRGYVVKKEPLGTFLRAIEIIQNSPNDFMEAIFPGKSLKEVLGTLKVVDDNTLLAIMGGALGTAPAMIIKLFAELSGIPEERLLEDPEIGPDGFIELLKAWIEINGIAVFTQGAKELGKLLKPAFVSSPKQNTGSKGSSPQP